MIIHAISAENLLKYANLQLEDLPGQGVIGISGHNESGKSSIGECLCFALFGRTFAVEAGEVQKLIRWGESRCSVSLDFSLEADGPLYRVSRMLDRDANHSASLCRADDSEHPIARGSEVVTERIHELLGYQFDEFIESFYLAQREITTPHPHSYAVKIMAGIAPLEYCRDELEAEVESEREALQTAEGKMADIDTQVAEMDFDEEALPRLEEARNLLAKQEQGLVEQRESLHQTSEEYQEREPRLRAAESSRGTASFMRFVFFLLALLSLGVWGLITQMPDMPLAQQVSSLLSEKVQGWGEQQLQMTLYAGIAFAVLFVLLWIRVASLNGRIRSLRESGTRLKEGLAAVDQLEAGLPEDIRAYGDNPEDADEARLDAGVRDRLLERLQDGSAGTQEVISAVQREEGWMDATRRKLQQGLADLDEALDRERGRVEEHAKLQGMRETFAQQVQDHGHRIEVRQQGNQLLDGATRHLSYRFNNNLRDLVSKTLPLFTEQRYQHLQIDDDLSVRAFSNEKRDFMDLDEISSGTQRQIMLALRLALSQELVFRVVKNRQFLFLDEPFAFFDEKRTRGSLQVLPKLSDELRQIWVVAQEFPEDADFDLRIHCDRETVEYSNA